MSIGQPLVETSGVPEYNFHRVRDEQMRDGVEIEGVYYTHLQDIPRKHINLYINPAGSWTAQFCRECGLLGLPGLQHRCHRGCPVPEKERRPLPSPQNKEEEEEVVFVGSRQTIEIVVID